jgi:hypothetical protein
LAARAREPIKLAERGAVAPRNRRAFFCYIGQVMRVVSTCSANAARAKRGGG